MTTRGTSTGKSRTIFRASGAKPSTSRNGVRGHAKNSIFYFYVNVKLPWVQVPSNATMLNVGNEQLDTDDFAPEVDAFSLEPTNAGIEIESLEGYRSITFVLSFLSVSQKIESNFAYVYDRFS